MDIRIDPEFRDLIPAHSEDEKKGLEEDLLRDGCRDPLVLWEREDGILVLIDGHTRCEICERHNLLYKTKILKLPSREHVKRWILENQLNRRNLSPIQRGFLAAQAANLPPHRPGKVSAQNCALTLTRAAEKYGLSRRTAQHFKRPLEHGSPKLSQALMLEIISASLASTLTMLAPEEQERVAEQCMECGHAKPAHLAAAQAAQAAKRRKKVAGNEPAAGLEAIKGKEEVAVGTPALERFGVVLADLRGRELDRMSEDPQTANHYLIDPHDPIKMIREELPKYLLPDAVLFVAAFVSQITLAVRLMTDLGFECSDIVMPKARGGSEAIAASYCSSVPRRRA